MAGKEVIKSPFATAGCSGMSDLSRFMAGLLLASIAFAPLVCAETRLGLASFGITGVRRVGDSLAVGISYDATSAGNPWQGGIYGYGPIEALDGVELDIWYFKEEGLTLKLDGKNVGWISYINWSFHYKDKASASASYRCTASSSAASVSRRARESSLGSSFRPGSTPTKGFRNSGIL